MLALILKFGCIITLAIVGCLSCRQRTNPSDDITVEVGKDLVIKCILDNCTVNSTDIYWQKDNTEIANVTITSNTTAQLFLSNVSEKDEGWYACKLRSSNYSYKENSNQVHVGYKPLKDLTLKCISYNLETLTCNWNVTYTKNVAPYWMLKYRFSRRSHNCTDGYTRSTNCTLDGIKKPYPATLQKFKFQIFGNNTLGQENATIIVDHFSNVKLAPPKQTKKLNISSRGAVISWKSPLKEETPNNYYVTYFISYSSVWNNEKFITNQTTATLSNLIPNSDYTVAISARLQNATVENEWSEQSIIAFYTLETAPETWEALTAGSYQEIAQENGNRSLVLYIKTLPSINHNGKNFTYQIRVEDFGILFSTNSTVVLPSVNASKNVRIVVSASNNVDVTESKTPLFISNKIDTPQPVVQDVINIGNKHFRVSWTSTSKPLNYTIFWCKEEKSHTIDKKLVQCKDSSFNWTQVECFDGECNKYIAVEEVNTDNYRFGVASKEKNLSNGIVWSECVIPAKRRKIPTVSPTIASFGSTWVEVKWNIDCANRIIYTSGYKIYYLMEEETERKERKFNTTTAGDVKFVLDNLHPGTKYSLQISSFTEYQEGELSEVITFKTAGLESGSGVIAIIISVAIVMIVLSALAVYIYKKFFRQKLKVLRNIVIPPGLVMVAEMKPTDKIGRKSSFDLETSNKKRESATTFTITLSDDRHSITSTQSDTSGFISTSVESVATSPTSKTWRSSGYVYEKDEITEDMQSAVPHESDYITVGGIVERNQEDSVTNNLQPGYVKATIANPTPAGYITVANVIENQEVVPTSLPTGYTAVANIIDKQPEGVNAISTQPKFNGYVTAASCLSQVNNEREKDTKATSIEPNSSTTVLSNKLNPSTRTINYVTLDHNSEEIERELTPNSSGYTMLARSDTEPESSLYAKCIAIPPNGHSTQFNPVNSGYIKTDPLCTSAVTNPYVTITHIEHI